MLRRMLRHAPIPGSRCLATLAIPLALVACGDDVQATGSGGATASSATGSGGGDATTGSNSSGGPGAGGDTGTGGGSSDGGSGPGGAGQGGDTTSAGGGAPTEPIIVGGDRPVEVHIPDSYEHGEPTPLIVLLHGYSATGSIQNLYFGLSELADEYGFLLAYPDGTVDTTGENFWNATPACCDFGGTDVDDSGYLQGVVDEASSILSVDPKRIYFFGHSNGGFMSYRMACEHADSVAAIASLAGATYIEDGDCDPSEPVPVLQIHGTADTTILYNGGANFGNAYPSAEETVETWASYNGCDLSTAEGEPRDLSGNFPGDDSIVTTYEEGCDPHGGAELWTMTGESHTPIPLSATFTRQVVEWLFAHPKP
jgi:polyhydroxybutyrate depolymerase